MFSVFRCFLVDSGENVRDSPVCMRPDENTVRLAAFFLGKMLGRWRRGLRLLSQVFGLSC